jgi:segregation and condensation protein A
LELDYWLFLGYYRLVPVSFKIERFEGPLDLLLQLVEQEKLDISQVSLATVADQFVRHMQANPDIPLEEMADFLVVAAKLVYIKSRLLMPDLADAALDEGPDLEAQLRAYRMFVKVSRHIDQVWKSGLRSYARTKRAWRQQEVKFTPPPGVDASVLHAAMQRVVARLEPLAKLPKAALERAFSVEDKIRDLFKRIRQHAKLKFSAFVGGKATKAETVASFLALLELVKQRFVRVNQSDLFEDIHIEAHPDIPQNEPFAEAYG